MIYKLIFSVCIFFVYANTIFSQRHVSENSLRQAEALNIPVKYKKIIDEETSEKFYLRKLIIYFREKYGLPKFIDTGHREKDIMDFNYRIKLWYADYPEFVDVLNLRTYDDFVQFDASCYDSPPVYKQGMNKSEEEAYEKRFNNWIAHHPDAPKILGDDEESKIKFEKELREFYSKYYKK